MSVTPECIPIAMQQNEILKRVSRVQSIEGGLFIPCVMNSLNGEFSNLGFRVPKFSHLGFRVPKFSHLGFRVPQVQPFRV
jgi:hypothetical protein